MTLRLFGFIRFQVVDIHRFSLKINMKLSHDFVIGLLLLFLLPLSSVAQLNAGVEELVKFRIDSIEVKEVKADNSFLQIDGLSADTDSNYIRITATYFLSGSTGKKTGGYKAKEDVWLDECVFSWGVVLAVHSSVGRAPEERKSVIMKNEITYGNLRVDSSRKKKRRAVVYIDPKIIGRYDDRLIRDGIFVNLNILVGAEIKATAWSRGSKFSTSDGYPQKLFPPTSGDGWFDSTVVKKQEYGLVSRLKTPWAWSNYSSYEHIIREVPGTSSSKKSLGSKN